MRGKGKDRGKCRVVASTPSDGAPSASTRPAGGQGQGQGQVIDLHTRLAAHRARNIAASAPKVDGDADADRPTDGGRTFADIRRSMLLVDEQSDLLDYHAKVRAVLPRDMLLSNVMTLGREYRDSTLRIADQYAPQIAGELGLEAHTVHAVLDRYLRAHFEKVISKIVDDRVAADPDADD